jgi:glycosyltransferase involved in cell wall biosynthesis
MRKYSRAYVLYANEKYFDIVSMCAKSIREVSKLPIIVYLLNSNLKVDLENTLTIKWECNIEEFNDMYTVEDNSNFYVNRSNNKIYNIFTQRPAIIANALTKYAEVVTYIDSDSVATPYIDRIFTMYPPNSTYPYFTDGIYEWMHSNGRGGAMTRDDLSTTLEHPICEIFKIDQYVRQGYRTSNIFVAGQNAIDWLKEWYWMCIHPKIQKDPFYYVPYQEETVANVLLWKYNQHHVGLPLVYTNGDDNRVEEVYTKCQFIGQPQLLGEWFRLPAYKENLLVFHGEKRLDVMQKMIDKIKEYNPLKENKKILFIAPHLSTGGLPQYLLKQIQTIKNEYDVYLVEYSFVSSHYVIQREKLEWILGDKFFALYDDKAKLLDIIEEVQPDVIHFTEVPEMFMDNNLTIQIYGNKDRNYFIVESTHTSQTTPSDLVFHPDKFILPDRWSQQKFSEQLHHIPNEVWEYPIENYYKDQKLAQEVLGLDSKKKHVLMVGLFTDGKNQGEIFEIAKQVPEIQFHFVGNQAPNFAEYWEPLMKNKPDNCVVWGEREDVHNFYQACDLFYFSSKIELNPLSIKEALSYSLPCLFRRLHTFMDTYDNNPLVTYITDDLKKTKQILLEKLSYV